VPHLRFDLNFTPPPEERRRFGERVVRHFADAMDTGTDHVAVTVRCLGPDDVVFGRAADPRQGIALLDFDIRRGRTTGQKRKLALAVIGELHRTWKVPEASCYLVYTEHDGESFQFHDRVLPSWSPGEDPLGGA
jgi:hypothetical protein